MKSNNKTGKGGFEKGKSGNPNGRPKKGNTLTDLIDKNLDKKKFVKAVCDLAYGGNVAAIREILDRLDGKVPETKNVKQTEPFKVTIEMIGSNGKDTFNNGD